jgi:hypothetical protein
MGIVFVLIVLYPEVVFLLINMLNLNGGYLK